MVKAILALFATAEAATLAVTWGDCGAKHATVDDLSPTSIKTGGSGTTLTGSGVSDEDVTSAVFTATVKAKGVKVASCSGDATSDIVCKLPAGVGTITVKAVSFPLKAGRVDIPVEVKVSALIPGALATTDTHIEAVDQNGESVICLDVATKKAASFEEIAEEINSGNHGWTAAVPGKFANVEDVKEFLGAFLPGDADYSEPDVVELLPSNAEVVAGGTLGVTWSDCGAKHAVVSDMQPLSIATGGTTTITGSGEVDEDVTSAHFTATVKALGVKISSCSGDGTKDITCKLPAGAGSIVVKALSFPIKAGTVKIPVDVSTKSIIPASLEKVDVHIEATEQNSESVICLDVHTKKAMSVSASIVV